jgi:hypothetical protein
LGIIDSRHPQGVFCLTGGTFMDQQKIVAGICSFLLLFTAIIANKANADEFNPVTEKVVEENYKPLSNKEILQKYANSHSLTDKELRQLLKAVGFEGKALKLAWATAKAESNGRPFAFNGNRKTGDSSYGVFQINMIDELGNDRRDRFDLESNAELFNPVLNAEIVFYMTKEGKDWSSWKIQSSRTLEFLEEYENKF